MKKDIVQLAKVIIIGAVLTVGIGYVSAAWGGPSGTPPGSNIAAPINRSASEQAKNGDPIPGSLLYTNGQTSADTLVVFTNADVGTGVGVTPNTVTVGGLNQTNNGGLPWTAPQPVFSGDVDLDGILEGELKL